MMIVRIFLLTAFLATNLLPPACAQAIFDLPKPGEIVSLSPRFSPVVLKGVSVHPEDPFLFDFIVDTGDGRPVGDRLTDEARELVKYFLAGLAVPEKDLWVNLSPVEKDRVMADSLSRTDAGREMLTQDYILKQITSSLIYPEGGLGRKFWEEVYRRSSEEFGGIEIPVDVLFQN